MPARTFKTQMEKDAWRDGWQCASQEGPRHDRPNYLTHEEREAFNAGWDEKTQCIAMNYRDDQMM